MVNHEDLGFTTFEDYRSHFFETLLPTNKTFEYFVDWEKVHEALEELRRESALLNSLTRYENDERRREFRRLVLDEPDVLNIFPIMIAERARSGHLDILDPDTEEVVRFGFSTDDMDEHKAERYTKFAERTGILSLLGEVKDVEDYVLGVEVGLDSNARKNRTGFIFEDMVQEKLEKVVPDRYEVRPQDQEFSLFELFGDKDRRRAKSHDWVIYDDDDPTVVIEANFYNSTGSKPVSIAESYPDFARKAEEIDVHFVWTTDGGAWHKMEEPLTRAMQNMGWILNFRMLDRLHKIV